MKNWIGVHIEESQPGNDGEVGWALFDGDLNLIDHGRSPLGQVRADAGPEAESADVYAYVLGSGVTLTEVNIPSRETAHLRKALPFMIEEHIIGDLRQTHLAVSTQHYGDSVPVAVVSHAQMIAWLEALHGAGLSPLAMIPEQLLLPREPGSLFVHIHRSRALVRLGDCRGVVVELENLPLILELALSQRAMPCSRIELSACADSLEDINNADAMGKEIGERLDRPVLRTNYEATLVELLSLGARAPQSHINLCQGGYRVDQRSASDKAQWNVTWITAAACVALFVTLCLGAGSFFEQQARDSRAEALALFRQMFPDEKRVINLRRQAETRLSAASSAGSGVMGAMAALANALGRQEAAGVKLQGLEYKSNDGALSAALSASSLDQIYGVEKLLATAGVSASVESPAEESGIANAKLQLRTR